MSAIWESVYQDNSNEICVLANSLWLENGLTNFQKAIIDSTDFGAEVTVRFAVKKTQAEGLLTKISEAGYGRDIPKFCKERFDCR